VLTKNPKKKTKDKTDPKSKVPSPCIPDFDLSPDLVEAAARWLRERRSGLEAYDAVLYEKRVQYFKGTRFVDCLLTHKIKNKQVNEYVQSREKAIALGNQMIAMGFFHRSELAQKKHEMEENTRLRVHNLNTFDEDGVYTWLIYPSQRRAVVQGFLLVSFAFLICLIKLWPLWLKIVVWWLSLIMLVSMTSIIVIRLALYIVMWIVGFRGIWLFPNLFDDDIEILAAFTPIIGRGLSESAKEEEKKIQTPTEGTTNKRIEQIWIF